MPDVSKKTIVEQFSKHETVQPPSATVVDALGRLATRNNRRPLDVIGLQKRVLAGAALLATAGAAFNMLPGTKEQPALTDQETQVEHSAITKAKVARWDTANESGKKTKYTGTITIRARAGATVTSIAKEYYGKLNDSQLRVAEKAIAQANNIGTDDALKSGENVKVFLTDPKVLTDVEGKTLEEIAESTGFDESALEVLNASTIDVDPNGKINDGDVILPVEKPLKKSETLYIVKQGDTFSAIAHKHNVDLESIVDGNNLDVRKLHEGQVVIVPGSDDTKDAPNPEKTPDQKQQEIQHILDTYGPLAKTVEDTYKVPHQVTLAQLIRETGWDGSSELSEKAHNFFGIKAHSSWTGDKYTKRTMEEMTRAERDANYPHAEITEEKANGNVVIVIEQDFRKYASDADCFNDYGEKITHAPYADALKLSDPKEVARSIAEHWATDSAYGDGLAKIIERLDSFKPGDTPPAHEKDNGDLLQRIQALEITPQSYEHFKKHLIDTSMEKYAVSPAMRGAFEGKGLAQRDTTGLMLHRWGGIYSGTKFETPAFVKGVDLTENQRVAAKAIDNLAGRGLGINYLLERDGTVFKLTSNKVYHIIGRDLEGDFKGQNLNGHLLGVEAESRDEGDLTNEQLASYVYLGYNFLEEQDLLKDGAEPLDLRKLVVGHGELSEYRIYPDENHSGMVATSPRADVQRATATALRAKLADLLHSRGYETVD